MVNALTISMRFETIAMTESYEDVSYLQIESYSGHPEVKLAAELLVEHVASKKQFMKARKQWIMAARKLIASLGIRDDDLFRFGTKKEYFSGKTRKQVWLTPKTLELFNAMRDLDWIRMVKKAIPPKYSTKAEGGMTSIYTRTDVFLNQLKNVSIEDYELDNTLPLVTLSDPETDQYLPLPEQYESSAQYRHTVAVLNAHYELIQASDLRSKDNKPLGLNKLRYRRRFTGSMGNGGRFYSYFCNQPKQDRLSITMAGEAVGSLDFSQLHPTLILLINKGVGEETNLFATGDVYDMPDYPQLPRSAHKKFINAIFNAKTPDAAARSIMTATEYWDIIEDCPAFLTYSGKGKRIGHPVWPEKPLKHAREYVDTFLLRHPDFQEAASSEIWGSMQLIDNTIMEYVLARTIEAAIPALPVHDELVIPVSKRYKVKQIMIEAFHEVTKHKFSHHEPKIKWETATTTS